MIDMPSPNFDERQGRKPYIILLHYTGMKTAQDALDHLTDPASKVSSHYTIDEAGIVYRHVQEEKRAWHAGQSYWQGETNINAVSIGIEIVNPGHEFGYKEFPDQQITAVEKLCQDIMSRHDIKFVLGHSDVAPNRKEDPGELFPWKELAGQGIGIWPESDQVVGDIDICEALDQIGYEMTDKEKAVIAFQRHYVPEVFQDGTEGQVTDLTIRRAQGLLSLS